MLDAFDEHAARALVSAAAMDGTAPLLSVEVRHLDGAVGRPDPSGGALTHLAAPYLLFAVGMLPAPELAAPIVQRLAELRRATDAWRSERAYPNFAERGADAGAFYSEEVHERLLEIRAGADPAGLFRPRYAER